MILSTNSLLFRRTLRLLGERLIGMRLIGALLGIGLVATILSGDTRAVLAQIDPFGPGATTLRIRITQQRFLPGEINVYGPTDIYWTNNSGETVVLRSGDLVNPGQTIYLPTLQVPSPGVQPAQIRPRLNAGEVDFAVTLPPGAGFVQRYTSPGTYRFHVVGGPNAEGRLSISGTGFLTSSPHNGESGVAPTRETIIGFSGSLDPATVTPAAFSAQAAGRPLEFRLHHSKNHRQVTLFYSEPLPGNTRVQVNIDGNILRAADGSPVDTNRDGQPGGEATLSFTTLSLSMVPGTRVCGRVFASELDVSGTTSVNNPLDGATITVDGREDELRTTTDAQGNFCLDPAPAGLFFVHIDGRTASNGVPAGAYYPYVGKTWESVAGRETNIGDAFLPLVVPGTLQPVSETEDTVIHFAPAILEQFPQFADVHLTVPAGSLFNDDGTPGGMAGIAPVPPDRIPGPLPEELAFPLVITVQTDGAENFDEPAPVCFPNLPDVNTGEPLAPGEKSALWSFNHDTGRFAVVGPMTATADGRLVCTDPGVGIPAPGWHSWLPATPGSGGPTIFRPPFEPREPNEEDDDEDDCDEGQQCKPKEDYEPTANGCGAQWMGEFYSPLQFAKDNPMGALQNITLHQSPFFPQIQLPEALDTSCSFKYACDQHDIQYGTCGFDKAAADQIFLNNMMTACGQCFSSFTQGNLRAACETFAFAYFSAVDKVGQHFYDPGQDEACDCEDCEAGAAGLIFDYYTIPSGPVSSNQETFEIATGRHYYAVVNQETGLVQRGRAGENGIAFESDLILAPDTRYIAMILNAQTLEEAFVEIITPGAGNEFVFPPFNIYENYGFDLDDDGLGALGEFVMATDPLNIDTAGDGIKDGAAVQQGIDPTGGMIVQTGIIASAETAGNAVDVCVQGDLAVVADEDGGLAVFNIFGGNNPLILAQIETPAPATAVACHADYVVAATGPAGVSILERASVGAGQIDRQVPLGGGAARAVVIDSGIAYVGLDNGTVARIDLATGVVLGQLSVASGAVPIEDVTIGRNFLYVLTQQNLHTVLLPDFTLVSSMAVWGIDAGQGWRWRLAAGDEILHLTHSAGVNTIDLGMPGIPMPIVQRQDVGFAWKQLVPTGERLGLVPVGTTPDELGEHDLSVYDISDPTIIDAFLVEYRTPGLARSVAIYDGLAYVADSEGGLQVIAFQSVDILRNPPTVQLVSNFGPGRVEANAPMRLTALTTDDIQVRDVEFYVNGEMVARDGSYPFEHRFTTPNLEIGQTLVVQAKATDTGGNFAWSEIQTRTVVFDATPPDVIGISPIPTTGTAGLVEQVSATFTEPIDPQTLTLESFRVFEPGPDGILDTADDVVLTGAEIVYDSATRTATLHFATALPVGQYRAELTTAIADSAGNSLDRNRRWMFAAGAVDAASIIRVTPEVRTPNDSFGYAVDIYGDWMVVGARSKTVNDIGGQGSAFLFTRDESTETGWREVKELLPSDGAVFDEFGSAVAISDDTVVIGSPSKRVDNVSQRGKVYVFARNAGGPDNWGEVASFATAEQVRSTFGSSLAIQGDRLIVGAEGTGAALGKAYLFGRSGPGATDWELITELIPSGGNQGFGSAVAFHGDGERIAIGAKNVDISGHLTRNGAVYIFEKDAGGEDNWGQVMRLDAGTEAPSVWLGQSVAIYGDLVVVGSQSANEVPTAETTAGVLYLFMLDEAAEAGWREVTRLFDPQAEDYLNLSRALIVDENLILAGAPGYNTLDVYELGAVYAFGSETGPEGPWSYLERLVADEPDTTYLGFSMAKWGDTLVVGGFYVDQFRGAVYVFDVGDLLNRD